MATEKKIRKENKKSYMAVDESGKQRERMTDKEREMYDAISHPGD